MKITIDVSEQKADVILEILHAFKKDVVIETVDDDRPIDAATQRFLLERLAHHEANPDKAVDAKTFIAQLRKSIR